MTLCLPTLSGSIEGKKVGKSSDAIVEALEPSGHPGPLSKGSPPAQGIILRSHLPIPHLTRRSRLQKINKIQLTMAEESAPVRKSPSHYLPLIDGWFFFWRGIGDYNDD